MNEIKFNQIESLQKNTLYNIVQIAGFTNCYRDFLIKINSSKSRLNSSYNTDQTSPNKITIRRMKRSIIYENTYERKVLRV